MVSRLRKNHEKMEKTASFSMLFDSLVLGSGDVITFEGRVMSNRPWYQITHDAGFNTSSYYDGPDFDRAFDMYKEIILAFKGVPKAEEFAKRKNNLETKIQQMIDTNEKERKSDMFNALQRNPMFLGMSDF